MKKIKGRRASVVIQDEVSGTDIHRANRALDLTGGRVKSPMRRLKISWSAEEILRSAYAAGRDAEILVHPDVAYALADKSPEPVNAELAITSLAALHGGKIPLRELPYVLGSWDGLVTEAFSSQNGRRFR